MANDLKYYIPGLKKYPTFTLSSHNTKYKFQV